MSNHKKLIKEESDFGQWAFTYNDFGKSKEKYLELTNKKEKNEKKD